MSNQDDNDEFSLFRAEMDGVKPLKPGNRVVHEREKKPIQVGRHKDTGASQADDVFSDAGWEDADCPEILSYASSGIQNRVVKQLRAGKLPVEEVLDLHGLRLEQARKLLLEFFSYCELSGLRNVIIIHGKGYRSKEKPVLKPMLNRWLRASDRVLAFHSAQPRDGGTGAVYVLLKK